MRLNCKLTLNRAIAVLDTLLTWPHISLDVKDYIVKVREYLLELKCKREENKKLKRQLADLRRNKYIKPSEDTRTVNEVLKTLTKSQREVVEFIFHDLQRENEILKERLGMFAGYHRDYPAPMQFRSDVKSFECDNFHIELLDGTGHKTQHFVYERGEKNE